MIESDIKALMVRISQLETLIGQMVTRGPVAARDAEKGYRLQTGVDLDGAPILTPWIPHPESGKTSMPMKIGQNAGMLNPTGDPRQGYPLRMGYSEGQPSPDVEKNMDRNIFSDAGVTVAVKAGVLTIACESAIDISIGGVTHRIDAGGITTSGGSISHDGLNVGSTHKHRDVMPGGALTGLPISGE